MATTKTNKLNYLYTRLAAGSPVTSDPLAEMGISADLAVHYVRTGWLLRLARGVFCRPGEELSLGSSLRLLERRVEGLHVGGKSALEWYGIRHYVSQRQLLHLYGWATARLSEWFVERFPAEYHRKRLFEESPRSLLILPRFREHAVKGKWGTSPDFFGPALIYLSMRAEPTWQVYWPRAVKGFEAAMLAAFPIDDLQAFG